MKFALFNNNKIIATKGAIGVCPICESELIPKCGKVKVNHWSHKTKCTDTWHENETEWHRGWKDQFPSNWQELILFDSSGEKHIADVKTSENIVIEFQHSRLSSDERQSRNDFYTINGKLIWVVDGNRIARDIKQFQNMLERCYLWQKLPFLLLSVKPSDEPQFVQDWKSKKSIVFVDFKNTIDTDNLFMIYPTHTAKHTLVSKLSRNLFVELLISGKFNYFFDKQLTEIKSFIERKSKSITKNNDGNLVLDGKLLYDKDLASFF